MCTDIPYKRVLGKLELLVNPSKDHKLMNLLDNNDAGLDSFLLENLKKIQPDTSADELSVSCDSSFHYLADIRWSFTECCLKHIETLLDSISNGLQEIRSPQMSVDQDRINIGLCHRVEDGNQQLGKASIPNRCSHPLLSVGEQKTILSTFQFIVALGLVPNLLEGVGLPLHMRSKFFQLLIDSGSKSISLSEKNRRLLHIVNVLMRCVRHSSTSALVLTQHLSDLLAALMQIVYCHDTEDSNKEIELLKHKSETGLNSDASIHKKLENSDYGLNNQDRDVFNRSVIEECRHEIKYIVNHVYKPNMVRELMILQGGPSSKVYKKQMKIPESVNKSCVLIPSPKWLRQLCGYLLTEILLGSNGISHILNGILEEDLTNDDKEVNWMKCDAIAMVIANCPLQSVSYDDYMKNISSQIIELLHQRDRRAWRHYVYIMSCIVGHLTKRNSDLATKYLSSHLLAPFLKCKSHSGGRESGYMVVSGDELNQSVEDIYQIFVLGAVRSGLTLTLLSPAVVVMFQLYSYIQLRKLLVAYRSWLEAILLQYIKHVDVSVSLSFLERCILMSTDASLGGMDESLSFSCDCNGAVCVVRSDSIASKDSIDAHVDVATTLLSHLDDSLIRSEFFASLLQKIQQSVASDRMDSQDLAHRAAYITVSCSLLDNFQDECLTSASAIINFVYVILETHLTKNRKKQSDINRSDSFNLALGMLVAVLTTRDKLSRDEMYSLECCLPLLKSLEENIAADKNLLDMISSLRIAIATHGLVLPETLSHQNVGPKIAIVPDMNCLTDEIDCVSVEDSNLILTSPEGGQEDSNLVLTNTESGQEDSKLVLTSAEGGQEDSNLVLTSTECGQEEGNMNNDATSSDACRSSPDTETHNDVNVELLSHQTTELNNGALGKPLSDEEYRRALADVQDESLPTRGHGLIAFNRLITSGDEASLANINDILSIALQHLDHPDSYIYLASINLLSSLAACDPKNILASLVEIYTSSRPSNVILKVGEALMKATRSLGDLVPGYRDLLVPAFLHGTRVRDASIRSSSLSNLAEICQLLHFSLSRYLNETIQCVSRILESDVAEDVREAAGLTLTLLLRGAGSDLIQILGSSIKDVYRCLKKAHLSEKSPEVLLHISLALEEINIIMKELVFPEQTLEKTIKVLDYT